MHLLYSTDDICCIYHAVYTVAAFAPTLLCVGACECHLQYHTVSLAVACGAGHLAFGTRSTPVPVLYNLGGLAVRRLTVDAARRQEMGFRAAAFLGAHCAEKNRRREDEVSTPCPGSTRVSILDPFIQVLYTRGHAGPAFYWSNSWLSLASILSGGLFPIVHSTGFFP